MAEHLATNQFIGYNLNMILSRHFLFRLVFPAFFISVVLLVPVVSFGTTVVCTSTGPGPCPASLPTTTITAVVPGITQTTGGGGVINLLQYLALLEELKKRVIAESDFNHDSVVDIIDLSILLFYYNKIGSIITPYDLNKDGRIGIEDISIMFYYWTIFR